MRLTHYVSWPNGRPKVLIDNHTLIAALEQLANVSRDSDRAIKEKEYAAIYRQCRLLASDGRLATVITRLLGDQEDKLLVRYRSCLNRRGQHHRRQGNALVHMVLSAVIHNIWAEDGGVVDGQDDNHPPKTDVLAVRGRVISQPTARIIFILLISLCELVVCLLKLCALSFYLVNTRMRSKRDIGKGQLCTRGEVVLSIVGGV